MDTLLAEDPSARPATAAAVVHALLPHVRDLPPLPGYYTPAPDDPAHLYAKALSTLTG